MRKLNLIIISFTISLIFNFICFEAIFPILYFVLFPIFNFFEKFEYLETIIFWILTTLFTIIIFLGISTINIFGNKKHNFFSIFIVLIILGVFLSITIPNHSNFPFKTYEDKNNKTSKEIDDFFKYKYKFKKANNYDKIETTILDFYKLKLKQIKNEYEFQEYFKSYDLKNKNNYSTIVDTIVFSPNADYFMATILIKDNDNYSQSSLIGKNDYKNIKIHKNDCIENVSGSDLKGMKLSVKKFYLIDFNKNKECFKIYENYNPSDIEYWEKVKKEIE